MISIPIDTDTTMSIDIHAPLVSDKPGTAEKPSLVMDMDIKSPLDIQHTLQFLVTEVKSLQNRIMLLEHENKILKSDYKDLLESNSGVLPIKKSNRKNRFKYEPVQMPRSASFTSIFHQKEAKSSSPNFSDSSSSSSSSSSSMSVLYRSTPQS